MEFKSCGNCGKDMGFKRNFGIGTLILVLVTGGLWLIAMPFYPKRCIGCGKRDD
jgi:hypothetical protein